MLMLELTQADAAARVLQEALDQRTWLEQQLEEIVCCSRFCFGLVSMKLQKRQRNQILKEKVMLLSCCESEKIRTNEGLY